MAVPLACALAIALSFISIFIAPISFVFIPIFARVLDPTNRKTRPEPATEEAEQSPPSAEDGLSAAEPREARAPEDSTAADAVDPEPEDTDTTNQAEDQQEEEDNGN